MPSKTDVLLRGLGAESEVAGKGGGASYYYYYDDDDYYDYYCYYHFHQLSYYSLLRFGTRPNIW